MFAYPFGKYWRDTQYTKETLLLDHNKNRLDLFALDAWGTICIERAESSYLSL